MYMKLNVTFLVGCLFFSYGTILHGMEDASMMHEAQEKEQQGRLHQVYKMHKRSGSFNVNLTNPAAAEAFKQVFAVTDVVATVRLHIRQLLNADSKPIERMGSLESDLSGKQEMEQEK